MEEEMTDDDDEDDDDKKNIRIITVVSSSSSFDPLVVLHERPKRIVTTTNMWKKACCLAEFPAIAEEGEEEEEVQQQVPGDDRRRHQHRQHHQHRHTAERMRRVLESIKHPPPKIKKQHDDDGLIRVLVQREIAKKLRGYSSQDKIKGFFDADRLITFPETIELLVDSRLGCYYCKKDVKVLYEQVRDSSQWTLDRVDNDAGHFRNNLLIACLGCNLRKKRMHPAKYVLTKQMTKVTKLNYDDDDASSCSTSSSTLSGGRDTSCAPRFWR